MLLVLLSAMTPCCGAVQCTAQRFALWTHAAASAAARPPEDAIVGSEDAAIRVGRFAGRTFATLGSTSQGVRAAKAHRLLLNGEQAPMTAFVQTGDVVTLLPMVLSPATAVADAADARAVRFAEGLQSTGALDVVYEDDQMAIVVKPAGIHTKPFGGALAFEHALPGVLSPPSATVTDMLGRPTAVHRLDARVAGVVVVAKTRSAAASLSQAFRERQVRKIYRALVLGRVDARACVEAASQRSREEGGDLRLELRHSDDGDDADEAALLHVYSDIDGRPSHTVVRIVEVTPHVQAGWLTTVELQPMTGRRHQLRKHCQALGHPICGDDLYAGEDRGFGGKRSAGLFLQAVEIKVPDPSVANGFHASPTGAWVSARVPEAPKFRRQRERAHLGWAYEQQQHRCTEAANRMEE